MADQPIRTLIQDIDLKRIALPEIQREFVWSEQKARDLIDSLYKKFPIGVILLWRPNTVENFFKHRNEIMHGGEHSYFDKNLSTAALLFLGIVYTSLTEK